MKRLQRDREHKRLVLLHRIADGLPVRGRELGFQPSFRTLKRRGDRAIEFNFGKDILERRRQSVQEFAYRPSKRR